MIVWLKSESTFRNLPGGFFTAELEGRLWSLERPSDIPNMLSEVPDSIGFIGSDQFGELSDETRDGLVFEGLRKLDARFVLATSEDKLIGLSSRITKGQPVIIATSYPRAATMGVSQLGPKWVTARAGFVKFARFTGSIESKPRVLPRIDGVFDIVASGNTLRDNRLKIMADDLGDIVLGAVWAREN